MLDTTLRLMLSWFGIYGIGNLRKNANHEVEKEKNTQYVRVYSRINNVHVLASWHTIVLVSVFVVRSVA